MSAHTPGPWTMDPDDCQDVVPASNPNHVGIAIVQRMDHNGVQYVWGTESEANAHLIAQAPTLLADLTDAAAQLRKLGGEVNAALAARFEATIAAAVGGAE